VTLDPSDLMKELSPALQLFVLVCRTCVARSCRKLLATVEIVGVYVAVCCVSEMDLLMAK
jgi:hypothetical protein